MNSPLRIATIPAALLLALLIRAEPTSARHDEEAPAPLPSDPLFDALTIDGTTITGRVRSIGPEGRLALIDEQGEEHVVEAGRLVKLSRGTRGPARSAPDGPLVILPEGDQIRGQIDAADERAIAVRSPVLGALTIPLEMVVGFTLATDRDLDAEAETIRRIRDDGRQSDRLLLANGDERDVTFAQLDGGQVSFLDADRDRKLPRESIRAVALDPGLVRAPEIPSPSFDLILTDGSRLRLIRPSASGGRLTGETTFGAEVEIPLNRLLDGYALTDAVAYLSDLESTREVTVPYVGPTRPARANASVLGGPITVAGRHYLRGLGTQSRSLLAYRLGPEDRRFQATAALDDAAAPLGNVVFRVLVDGEPRFASPPIAAGDPPAPIDVDVSGGQFLILATEFGRGGGVRDYAAWIEARLIRSTPDADPEAQGAGN